MFAGFNSGTYFYLLTPLAINLGIFWKPERAHSLNYLTKSSQQGLLKTARSNLGSPSLPQDLNKEDIKDFDQTAVLCRAIWEFLLHLFQSVFAKWTISVQHINFCLLIMQCSESIERHIICEQHYTDYTTNIGK